MKKTTKRTLKVLAFSLAASTLVGCSNGKAINQDEYIEPVYEEKAVFVETYQNKHIDVLVGETKKMYEIPPSLEKKIEQIKQNDIIIIEYSLDNELKKNIKDIRTVGETKKVASEEPKEKEKPKKPKEKNTELNVFKEGEWVKEQATVVSMDDQYTVHVLEGFEMKGNKIVSVENESHFIEFEELPADTEIKPQRWRASDELKKIGELRELLGDNIYDPNFREAEFVFTAQGDAIQRNVVVRSEEGHLMRYAMSFPSTEENPTIEPALWAMMEGLEYQ